MTSWRSRGLAAGVVAVLLTGFMSVGATADGASLSANTCHDTVKHTIITLLAGDHDYLAYALGYRIDLATGDQTVADRCGLPRFDTRSEYLWVRSRSGKRTDLGKAPKFLDGDGASMIGSTLYDVAADVNHPSFRAAVHWWNLKKHTKGSFKVPAGEDFQSGGPKGAILSDYGKLIERTLTGKRISLGRPFGRTNDLSVLADAAGLAAFGPHAVWRYETFAKVGHYTKLQVTGPETACTTLGSTALGCFTDADDNYGLPPQQTEIVPLNGEAPTVAHAGGGFEPAFAGRTLIYTTYKGLGSFSVAHPRVTTGSKSLAWSSDAGVTFVGADRYPDLHQEWFPLVSAYGGVATVNVKRTRVVLATNAMQSKPLFALPRYDH